MRLQNTKKQTLIIIFTKKRPMLNEMNDMNVNTLKKLNENS